MAIDDARLVALLWPERNGAAHFAGRCRQFRRSADLVLVAAALACTGGAPAAVIGLGGDIAGSDPVQSRNARMYTIVVLLALLSLIAAVDLVREPGWSAALLFVLANWLLVGYHYYALMLVGTETLFFLMLALRRQSWRAAGWWGGAIVLSVAPIFAWMAFAPGFRETFAVITGGIGKSDAPPAWLFFDGLWRDLSFGGIRWQPPYAVWGYVLAPLIVARRNQPDRRRSFRASPDTVELVGRVDRCAAARRQRCLISLAGRPLYSVYYAGAIWPCRRRNPLAMAPALGAGWGGCCGGRRFGPRWSHLLFWPLSQERVSRDGCFLGNKARR